MATTVWKIMVNYGTEEEMAMTDKLTFRSYPAAVKWCKENGYQTRCAMCERKFREWVKAREHAKSMAQAMFPECYK